MEEKGGKHAYDQAAAIAINSGTYVSHFVHAKNECLYYFHIIFILIHTCICIYYYIICTFHDNCQQFKHSSVLCNLTSSHEL